MNNNEGLLPEDHLKVSNFIEKTTGIQLPAHKRSLIETRLRKRLKVTGCTNLKDYIEFALSSAGELTEQVMLIDALTTNKTDFFREPAHFEFLTKYIKESLLPINKFGWKRPFSVWCAASSTGEEPYTIALVLSELQRQLAGFHFKIYATDIAPSVLKIAKSATYDSSRILPVPEILRKRYFLRSKNISKKLIRMSPELRNHVVFDNFNLITGDYRNLPTFDAIFCRNVMIYFSALDRDYVVRELGKHLRVQGLLFIGHSESLGSVRESYEQLIPTVYKVKGGVES